MLLAAVLSADVEAMANRLLATKTTPAFSVAVIENDRVTYTGAFGVREVETSAPATPDTRFYIASATKPFTAAAARLTLNIDAPLDEVLPQLKLTPPLEPSRISVRDLLAHRPGFSNGAVGMRTANTGDMTDAEIVASLARFTKQEPIEFAYGNTAYVVAALAIEHATQKSWQEVLAERFFKPLQMTSTTTTVPAANVAFGYEDGVRLAQKHDATLHAAGGIYSTAPDLAKWLIAQMNPGVIPARVLRDLHAPQITLDKTFIDIRRHAYALGWYHGELDGELLVHHFGGYNGSYAHMSFMPERRVGVVVLSNGGPEAAEVLAEFLYDRTLGKQRSYDEKLVRIADNAAQRARDRARLEAKRRERHPWRRDLSSYAGSFVSERLGTIAIREEDGRLLARMGLMVGELLPAADGACLLEWSGDGMLHPVRIDGDTLDWGGRVFTRPAATARATPEHAPDPQRHTE